MTPTTKPLAQVQLGTSLATIYTCPAQPPNAMTQVNGLWICNTDSVARTVTLRMGAGSLTVANSLLEAASIDPNTTWVLSGSEWFLTMSAGMVLQGLASAASKITVTVGGQEII